MENLCAQEYNIELYASQYGKFNVLHYYAPTLLGLVIYVI